MARTHLIRFASDRQMRLGPPHHQNTYMEVEILILLRSIHEQSRQLASTVAIE